MRIYQLYYRRMGKQEIDAGWRIAAASKETPQVVKNACRRIADSLNEQRDGMPPQVLDIRMEENYVFLSHMNYYSQNKGTDGQETCAKAAHEDSRGNSFFHTYAVRADEYLEYVRKPEQIFGILPECFVQTYDGVTKELPMLEKKLPYRDMDIADIAEKYGLTQEKYQMLMQCVYRAMEMGETCHILTDRKKKKEVFCEIGFCIFRALPYRLRGKASVFSGQRRGCQICFSDRVKEKEIFYHLDTGEYRCPQIVSYDWMRVAVNLQEKSENLLILYDGMERVMRDMCGNEILPVKCLHAEVAYRAAFPNVSKEELPYCMRAALSIRAVSYEKLDEYYAYLLNRYIELGMEVPKEDLRKLQMRCRETNNENLKRAYYWMFTSSLYARKSPAVFESIYKMEQENPGEFACLKQSMQEFCPQFLQEYYVSPVYLENMVKDGKSALKFCRETLPQGKKQQNVERQGAERQNIERQGIERQGIERQDIERQGIERQSIERQSIEKQGIERVLERVQRFLIYEIHSAGEGEIDAVRNCYQEIFQLLREKGEISTERDMEELEEQYRQRKQQLYQESRSLHRKISNFMGFFKKKGSKQQKQGENGKGV